MTNTVRAARSQAISRGVALTDLFDSGWRAALAVASAVGAIAVAAKVVETAAQQSPYAAPEAALVPQEWRASADINDAMAGRHPSPARAVPASGVSAVNVGAPPATGNLTSLPFVGVAPAEPSRPPPANAMTSDHADASPIGPRWMGPASPAATSFDLSVRRPIGRRAGPLYAAPRVAPRAPPAGNALETRVQGWVPDWRAPAQRDISLFVAADDEAVSWSLSDSSPNHGRLAYQGERVEVGDMSAGVSMAVEDMQVSLAYVSRDAPSALGYSEREDYAGLVWTYRR